MTLSLSVISFFIEFLIALNCLDDILDEKMKKRYTVLIGISLYAIALTAFVLIENIYVNLIVFFAVNLLFAFLCYECNIRQAVLCALMLSVVMVVSEFLFMMGYQITATGNIENYGSSLAAYTVSTVFSKTLYFVLTKIVIYFGLKFNGTRKRRIPSFLFIFPVCSLVILITFWVISSSYSLSQGIENIIAASGIAIVVSIIFTYVFYGKTTRELDELYRAQSEAERINTDIAYYSILDKQNERLKAFIHDEKNHLTVIKSLADNEEVSRYIDKVYGEIRVHSMFGNTKNKMLDLMLNKYQYVCEAEGIEFYLSIKTANFSFVESHDLIAILGNLLDNAVEAARNSRERRIDLSINRTNGFDVLTCSNSCDKKPRSVGKILKSTKTDGGEHGIGLKSVRKAIKKYDGEFEWKYDEEAKEFSAVLAVNIEKYEAAEKEKGADRP